MQKFILVCKIKSAFKEYIYIPAVMADATPAKTKRKVVMNSTTRAWMQSGCVASRLVPKAIFAMISWRSNTLSVRKFGIRDPLSSRLKSYLLWFGFASALTKLYIHKSALCGLHNYCYMLLLFVFYE